MKIRIGNDVQLKVSLSLGEGVDYTNIQSMRAIFVNATLKDQLEKEYKKKNRFIGRFPIEPFVDEFTPCNCCINSMGYPRYNVKVFNQYNGFGVNPDWDKCFPVGEKPITEYQSEVSHTSNARMVNVLFPAEAQRFVGQYDLILTINIYQAGFKNNIRTITVDFKNAFELVETSSEADIVDPVQIELNNQSESDQSSDIYIVSGTYSDNDIKLRRNDNGVINVDISPVSGWYEGE